MYLGERIKIQERVKYWIRMTLPIPSKNPISSSSIMLCLIRRDCLASQPKLSYTDRGTHSESPKSTQIQANEFRTIRPEIFVTCLIRHNLCTQMSDIHFYYDTFFLSERVSDYWSLPTQNHPNTPCIRCHKWNQTYKQKNKYKS